MDPSRKRKIRLIVALSAAVLLAGGLVYTSFTSSSEAVTPIKLLAGADGGRSYQLTGKVADGTVRRRGETLHFRVRERTGTASVPVRYTGAVPDPFREGREIIVTVRKQGTVFVGERDSLITKCPSKFSKAENSKS
jgi:cytochrome c-type biogenesis protein CcmE